MSTSSYMFLVSRLVEGTAEQNLDKEDEQKWQKNSLSFVWHQIDLRQEKK